MATYLKPDEFLGPRRVNLSLFCRWVHWRVKGFKPSECRSWVSKRRSWWQISSRFWIFLPDRRACLQNLLCQKHLVPAWRRFL